MRQAIVVFALCIVTACSPSRAYCDPLMATSELDGTLRVTVSAGLADELNRRVVALLDSEGFSYETSASDNWLGPPDAAGRQSKFRNIKTIGCTSQSVVWSENVVRADEFIITVHHTAFGSESDSAELMADLVKAVQAKSPR